MHFTLDNWFLLGLTFNLLHSRVLLHFQLKDIRDTFLLGLVVKLIILSISQHKKASWQRSLFATLTLKFSCAFLYIVSILEWDPLKSHSWVKQVEKGITCDRCGYYWLFPSHLPTEEKGWKPGKPIGHTLFQGPTLILHLNFQILEKGLLVVHMQTLDNADYWTSVNQATPAW